MVETDECLLGPPSDNKRPSKVILKGYSEQMIHSPVTDLTLLQNWPPRLTTERANQVVPGSWTPHILKDTHGVENLIAGTLKKVSLDTETHRLPPDLFSQIPALGG